MPRINKKKQQEVRKMMSVTIPRFMSASMSGGGGKEKGGDENGKSAQGSGGLQSQGGGDVGSGDPLDFDILAEYLLDDGTNPGALMPGFDFSNENGGLLAQPFADPLADAAQARQTKMETPAPAPPPATNVNVNVPTAAPAAIANAPTDLSHVQHIIATQAAAQHHQLILTPSAPVPAPTPLIIAAPTPATPTITTTTTAAPMAAAPFAIPAQPPIAPGPLPPAPTPPTYRALAAIPITLTAPPGTPILSLQHHPQPSQQIAIQTLPAPPKRQRLEPSTPTPPTTIATTPAGAVMTLNGQLIHSAIPQRGRQKTQAQIDRRRERNRILARRTRLRKKFFFESLQKDVTDLQRENTLLKGIVRNRINPETAKTILDDCNANHHLPSVVAEHCGDDNHMDQKDFNLVQSIQKSQKCFVITDPSLHDNPIVYASEDFLKLTGYSREEVLGRNCRFLQGTQTSTDKINTIRNAVHTGEDCSVTLINYTADGTAFWNKLFIAALRDAQNNIVNYIGVIIKIPSPQPDDAEAGKTLPGDDATPDAVSSSDDVTPNMDLDDAVPTDTQLQNGDLILTAPTNGL